MSVVDGLLGENKSEGRLIAVAGTTSADTLPARWLVLITFDSSYSVAKLNQSLRKLILRQKKNPTREELVRFEIVPAGCTTSLHFGSTLHGSFAGDNALNHRSTAQGETDQYRQEGRADE